jgi:methylmalonyl-CoA/ethylmalonyl-CoA epimerase
MKFRLHHIGYLVADIDSAAREFVTRFGYVAESDVIDDDRQTARVQFLRQPGAGHWLELITANRPGGKLSKALEHGGGLHHLCYEVEDLPKACDKLRIDGMLPLGEAQPAAAFSGRSIAWFMDRNKMLIEIVENGAGQMSLASIATKPKP